MRDHAQERTNVQQTKGRTANVHGERTPKTIAADRTVLGIGMNWRMVFCAKTPEGLARLEECFDSTKERPIQV